MQAIWNINVIVNEYFLKTWILRTFTEYMYIQNFIGHPFYPLISKYPFVCVLVLQERLKEQRTDLEDKADKRSSEGTKSSLSYIPAPVLHPRKAPAASPTPSTSYRKAVTPVAVTPLPSSVTALKAEERTKLERTLPQQSYSHPSNPASRQLSPVSASPPPSHIRPKQESVVVSDKDETDLQKPAHFPSVYPGL